MARAMQHSTSRSAPCTCPPAPPKRRWVWGRGSSPISQPQAEWRECLAKARFLDLAPARFDLIETMAFDPHTGIPLLERHLARLTASARALGFAFDRHATRNELQAATFRLREPARVRLLLSRSGAIAVDVTPCPPRRPGRSMSRWPPCHSIPATCASPTRLATAASGPRRRRAVSRRSSSMRRAS
ncbi:aminotransferase class IV [Sphingomonas panni]